MGLEGAHKKTTARFLVYKRSYALLKALARLWHLGLSQGERKIEEREMTRQGKFSKLRSWESSTREAGSAEAELQAMRCSVEHPLLSWAALLHRVKSHLGQINSRIQRLKNI